MIKSRTMKNYFCIFILFCGSFQYVYPQDSLIQNKKNRFQSAIEKFLHDDSLTPPPHRSIEFIGSSIFRRWDNLKEDMAPLPVFNRAFGGSRTHEVLFYMDEIVFPYNPKIIVYYCGSNDASGSVPVSEIVGNIKQFIINVENHLPDTKVVFVSINRSPARKSKWGAIDSTNAFIKEFCSKSKQRRFIDVNPILFDSHGNPRFELYLEDQLHFKAIAYGEFTKIIKPILMKEWSQVNKE